MDPEPPHAAGAEAGAWAQQLREAGLRSAPDAPEAAEEAAAFATALRAACADYSAGAAQRPPPPSPSAGPETPAEFWLRVGWCERVQQTLRDATQGRLLPSQGEVEDVRAAVAALGEALAAAATEAAERGAPPAEPAAGLIVAGDLGLWEWRSPAAAGRMVSHARLVNTYAVALGLPTLRALTHTLLRWGGRTLTVTCLAPLASGAQAAATGSCSARLQLTLLAEALGGRQAAAALGVDGRLYVADPRLLCEAPHLAMLRSSAGAAGGAAAAADEASMQAVLRQAGGSPTGQELCAALRSHGMGARHLGALRRAAIASGSGTVAEACLAEAVARSAKAVALGSRLLAAAAQSDEPGAAARVVAALCGSLPEVWQSAVLPQLRDRYSAGGGEGAWADLSDGLSPERQERAAARLCDLCGLPPAPPPRWVRSGVWRPVPVRTSLPDTNFLYSAEAASSAEAAAASDPSSPAAQLLTASLRAARGDEGASEALLRYGSTAPAPWGGAHAEECAAALAFGGAEPSDAARVQRESIAHRLEAMDPEEGSVAAPDWADIARQIGVAAGMQPAAGPPRSPASSGSGGTEAVLPPGAAERCHSGLSAATEISRVAAAYSCWLPLLYALRSVPGGSTEEVAQELLELLTELVGDRDPEVAALCSEIGTARMQRGGLRAMEAAEPYLLRALAVFRRAAGPEAPDTATALVNLGYLSYRTARLHSKRSSRVPSFGMRPHLSPEGREHYEKAEDAFLSVLQMPEGALPPDVEGHALNNLGSCYVGMGRWSDAEGCFERAVALGGVGSAQDAELAAQNLAAMRDARRTQGAVTIQAFVRGSAGRRRARDRRAARAAAAEGTVKEVPAAPAEEPPAAPGSAPEPQPPDSGAAPAPAQDQGEELEEGQPQRPPPSALPPPSGAQEQPAEPQPSAAPPPQEAGPQRQPQGFVKAMAAQWDDKEKKAQREESEGERRERLEAARKERQQEKAAQPRPAVPAETEDWESVVLQRIVNGYLGRCAVHAVYTAWLAWRAEQKAARSRGEHAELEARVGLDEAERSERREVHTEQRKEEYGIRRRYLAGILRKCADPFGGMSDELTPAEALMVGETQEEEERDLYEHKESDERRRLAAKWQHWRMDVLALQASGPALVGQEARERKRNAMTAWRTRREIAKQMLFERSRFALHHLRRMVSVEEWRLPKLRYLQCLAWAARATPLHASRGRGLAVMFDAAMRAPEYGGRLGRGRGLAAVADAFGYATSLTDIRREEDGKRGADAEAEHAEAAQRREAARAEEHTCRRELAAQEHSERIALEAAGRASARRAHAAAAAAADQDAPLTPRPTPAGVPLEEQNARWAIGKAETAERAALDSRRFRHAALVALRMPPRVGSAQYQRTPQQQLPPRASSARPPARSSLRSRTAPSGPSRREPVHFDHSAQYSGDRHHAPSAGSGSVPPHEGVAGEGDDGEWLFGAAEAASPATDATPFAHTPHQTRMSSDGGSPTGWSPLGRSSRAGARGRSASAQSVSSAGSASGPSPLRKRQLRSYSPDGREVTSRRLVERNLRRQVFSARARQGLPPGGEWDADGKYIGRTAERIGAPRQRSAPARRATDPVDHFSLKHWQSLMEAQEEMEGPGWESDELRVVHGQVVAHAVRQHKEGYEEEIGDYGQLSGAVAGQAVVLRRDLDGLWRDVGGQAATRLQANWRGFLVRSRDRPLQRARERWAEWERRAEQDDAYAAARLIQKRVRGILGRRYVREWEQTREAAVVVLQWRWREHIIRRDQREAAIERNAAASVIQEWYGGFAKIREARALRERKRAQFLKEELQRAERDRIRREDGAARVQRWWRALQTTRRLIENERLMLLLKRESRRGLFTLDEDPEVRSRRHVEEDAARAAADRRAHAPAKVLHTVSAAGRRARERFAGAERCTAVEQWRMEQQRRGHNRRSAATAMQRWWRAAHARYRYRIDLARYKKAAVTAQRVYRGHACRNRVLKDKRVRKAAAIRVQAWFRCLVKRSKFLSWRHAGCVFQAVWRGRMQRREWEIIRKQRALERRWQIRRTAATKLQSAVRARNARRLVGGMLADRLGARECSKRAGAGAVLSRVLRGAACRRKQRRRAAAARAIQVWFRYLVANRAFHARWKVVDRAAQTIGRVVRVKVAHIKAQRRRAEVRREREAELRSEHRRWGAITIQCGARMLLARNAARRRREHLEEVRRREAAERELKRRHVAAQRIQTRWRGYAARLEFGSIHAECRRAACMIQARWRGWATRRCWGAFLPASRAAALVLHRFGRRCVMIHRVRLRKALRAEAAGRALRRAAAVHIQAQTRGMLARMRRDRILRRRYRAALDIERVWRGFVGRCSTREAMHMRRFGVRTIQRTWRGHSARMRARKLAAARAARRRQQQLWERELFLALDARLNRLVEVEDVQRPCLEEVEHGAWLDIIEAFDAEGRRVRKRQELIWRRRRWRQSCEGRELATMSAIDAELTALWQTAYDAWDATRAAARRESEAAEDVSRRRISGAEVREWAVVHRTCSHGLREVRVGEAQRAWTRRREEERLAEERRRQEEESALSSGQRRLRQWRESRIEGRRKQEAEQRDERRRRKFLSAREKCSEFAQHYLSRRMAECRKTIAAEPDSSDASPSPPRRQRDPVLAACVRNASSPQRQMACALSPAARRFASPPRRSSMTDAAVRTSESIPLSDLQRSHRPATAGAKDAKLPAAPGLPRAPADSVMAASMSGSCSASFVAPPLAAAQPSASSRGIDGHWGEGAPLRAARAFGDAAEAAEWLARQGGPGSPLARRRPSSAGPLGAARRQHVLPGTSARGRVQHYLPLLAANDRGLVEVDLAGAGLSDVLVHSLAVALRGNRRCAALQLDRNRMTDAALEVLAPALHTHPTLASITLRDNLLTDDGVQMLVHAVQANPVLRRIDVTGNAAVTSAALEELEGALVANQKLRTAKRTANAAATAAAQQPLFVEG